MRVALTLLVVLGHAARTAEVTPAGGVEWLAPEAAAPLYFQAEAVMSALSTWIYRWHMPAFMALSGAVYALAPIGDFDRLCMGKARRLLAPFLACGLLFMLPVKLWARFYTPGAMREALMGFLSGAESGHLWFLVALFWCFLLFWPIRRFVAHKAPLGGLLAAIVAARLLALALADMPYFELLRGAEYLGWFAAGFAFAAYKDKLDALLFGLAGRGPALRAIPWLCLAALCGVSLANERVTVLPRVFIVAVNFGALYVAAGLWARRRTAKTQQEAPAHGRLFGLLLAYAFPIYLYHDPLEYAILRLSFEHGLLLSAPGVALYWLARTLGVTALSIGIGWLVRKIIIRGPRPGTPKGIPHEGQ